ncbi:MAG: hypothetical protein HN686_11530 [Bacteroidetes bacterium]|jgi:hypothetical protein|nr:hypothetical protein [Bacteroidota bacterium]MBT4412271.1 hypothetical protein [Bacteroidota bacterium]MBT6051689.1 hypothetical protein [Candidatus Scalindua sp.]MBT7464608.1 hypothetical protein [Bacteroidota bacterium]
MPTNLLKVYPALLELNDLNITQRNESLQRIFERDVANNSQFKFNGKKIRPLKVEGVVDMEVLFKHLTTEEDEDETGIKLGSRSFDIHRSNRLHFIKPHIDDKIEDSIRLFSYNDRKEGRTYTRTYIYNLKEKYVIVLESQRSNTDYYLLSAYYLYKEWGEKAMKKKYKNRLLDVY